MRSGLLTTSAFQVPPVCPVSMPALVGAATSRLLTGTKKKVMLYNTVAACNRQDWLEMLLLMQASSI